MASKKSKQHKPIVSKIRERIPPDWLPRLTLEHARRVAEVLYNVFAAKPTRSDDIAKALAVGAKSSYFRHLMSSALAYGIVNKEETGVYSLSEVGRKIVAPTYDNEAAEGIRKAVLNPFIPTMFYSDYNGHPLPRKEHLPDVLESRYEVPHNRVASAIEVIVNNGVLAGVIQRSSSSDQYMINLSGAAGPVTFQGLSEERSKEYPPVSVISGVNEWSRICFFVTPIGEDGSEIRRHADMMLRHLLTPVLEKFELDVVRADKIERSGLITQQIFEYLVKARLCIADLSFSNPNVFYELGVRHICKLPTIQVIKKGDKIPFDVSQGRTIVIDTSDIYTVIDRVESAKRELAEHVRHFQSSNYQDSPKDNPVHVFLPDLRVILPK